MAVETTARPEAPTAGFKGDVHVHNNAPRRKDVERIAELPVLDQDGKPHTFQSLLGPANNNERSRTLIIFIRHFFCGVSITSPFGLLPGIAR